MTNQEWVAQLKEGDTVIVHHNGIGLRNLLQKVAKVTPSGRVTLQNGAVYNPNGTSRGVKEVYFGSSLIEPTEERLAEIATNKLRTQVRRLVMNRIEWNELDIWELEYAMHYLSKLDKTPKEEK